VEKRFHGYASSQQDTEELAFIMTNDQLSMTNGGGRIGYPSARMGTPSKNTRNTASVLGRLPLGFGHSRIIRERVRE
jgi:hypothetical protein